MPTYYDPTFSARAIGARTDAAASAVDDVSAEEDRLINGILNEGWLSDSSAFQVAADSPASMDVIVGSGVAKADRYVVAGDDAGQETYIVRLDDATDTITVDAADGTNPRIDEIYLVVSDVAYDGGTISKPRLAYQKGTAAASPSAPGPDGSWSAYVKLATISVAAGASSITSGNITDNRSRTSLAGPTVRGSGGTPGATQIGDSATVGTANTLALSDHKHSVAAGTPGTISPDDSAAAGSATTFARSDHKHGITAATAGASTPGDSAAEGSASTFARSDHKHSRETYAQQVNNTELADYDEQAGPVTIASGPSQTWIAVESFTLAIPAGWGSWRCSLWATLATTAPDNADLELRAVIDGSGKQPLNVDIPTKFASGDAFPLSYVAHRSGMSTTGSRTVTFQVRELNNSSYDLYDINVHVIARRTG